LKYLAATYSRGSYTTTTIGKAAFDGRVRDGNGSDHSFMATKSQKISKEHSGSGFQEYSLKTTYRFGGNPTIRELKSQFPTGEKSDQAARPISISPLKELLPLHA
jgi:hypothetical protein